MNEGWTMDCRTVTIGVVAVLIAIVLLAGCGTTSVPPSGAVATLIRPITVPSSTQAAPISPASTAAPAFPCTVTAPDGLNLRLGPDTAYAVIRGLEYGTGLTPQMRTAASDWVAV